MQTYPPIIIFCLIATAKSTPICLSTLDETLNRLNDHLFQVEFQEGKVPDAPIPDILNLAYWFSEESIRYLAYRRLFPTGFIVIVIVIVILYSTGTYIYIMDEKSLKCDDALKDCWRNQQPKHKSLQNTTTKTHRYRTLRTFIART